MRCPAFQSNSGGHPFPIHTDPWNLPTGHAFQVPLTTMTLRPVLFWPLTIPRRGGEIRTRLNSALIQTRSYSVSPGGTQVGPCRSCLRAFPHPHRGGTPSMHMIGESLPCPIDAVVGCFSELPSTGNASSPPCAPHAEDTLSHRHIRIRALPPSRRETPSLGASLATDSQAPTPLRIWPPKTPNQPRPVREIIPDRTLSLQGREFIVDCPVTQHYEYCHVPAEKQ